MNDNAPQQYTDPQAGFTICVPPGWDIDLSGRQNTRAIFFHPLVVRDFRSNVNVVVEPIGGMDPAEYYAYCRLQVKRAQGPPASGAARITEHPAGGLLLEYAVAGGQLPLRVLQRILAEGKRAYIVSCTAPLDSFETYRPKFEVCLASFTISREDSPRETRT